MPGFLTSMSYLRRETFMIFTTPKTASQRFVIVNRTLVAASVAIACVGFSEPLHAGKITGFSWTSGIASIAGIVAPPPIDPNNDDVIGLSPNVVQILQKDYTGIGFIDIVFEVMDSGGVTEYAIVEGVQNNTGSDWASYHVQLGFDTGADFEISPPDDGLDFDAPFYNSTISFDPTPSFPFPSYTPSEDVIDAFGPPGQLDLQYREPFVFHIDVPDGITSFTLRQYPVAVPEPTTALLALGLFGLLPRLRRVR
jgi:hypothetical protein